MHMAGLGSEVPAWLGGGNEDETHGPNLCMKGSGQVCSVVFALIRMLFYMKIA